MADKKLTEYEYDAIENSLSAVPPQPLGHTNGSVMFEAGRAVGREEALTERRKRNAVNLTFWRLATAASLGLAILGFSKWLTPNSNSQAIVENKTPRSSQPPESIDPSRQDNIVVPIETDSTSDSVADLQTMPFNGQQTMIGVRSRLMNSNFRTAFDTSDQPMSLSSEPTPSAIQLLHKYTSELRAL